jgi:amino acid permease
LGISLAFSDLGVILSLVGATGSTVVSYILPGVFYLSLYRKDLIAQGNKEGNLMNVVRKSTYPESGFSDNNINKKLNNIDIYNKNIDIKEHKNKKLYDWKVFAAFLLLIIGLILIPVSLVILLSPYVKHFFI